MDDISHYESYGLSREEAIAQAKADRASTRLIYAVFKLLFIPIRLFFLLLPSIFCAYVILEKLFKKNPYRTERWEYFWWMCGIVYFLECLIFFLKGWQQALRNRGNRLWMPIIALTFLYCFALPSLMLQQIIGEISRRPGHAVSDTQTIIAWGAGIALGWFIYRRYKLTEESAPFLFSWTYRSGRAL
ncbi:MAG TPA: hypothetical protein VGM30_05185 [Puia sp.]|jgi:uncharacterized protein YneF (UPF0154 family)